MAMTVNGMVEDCEALDKILYVSGERLKALADKENVGNAKASDVTEGTINELMFPEDLPDDSVLVPVDISGADANFDGDFEKLLEKLGPNGTADAIIQAAELFNSTTASKFAEDERPIAMTVAQWKKALDEMGDGNDDDDDDDCGEEDGEEEELDDAEDEVDAEDDGEEGEEEDDDADGGDSDGGKAVEPAAKIAKTTT